VASGRRTKAKEKTKDRGPGGPGGPEPFSVKDCSLVATATGVGVQNLREFREALREVPAGSIYHHFWGRLLQPLFAEPEYNNDFASWAYRALHDKVLAERLSVVDPTEFSELEELRQELVEIVEMRLDESELIPWAKADQQFHFIQAQIVIFDTGVRVAEPRGLASVMPAMSASSVFYHFIDARRRTPDRRDDLSTWLAGYGETYADLCSALAGVDPYFSSLRAIRAMLSALFEGYFGGGKR